jgi:hypothetical protein
MPVMEGQPQAITSAAVGIWAGRREGETYLWARQAVDVLRGVGLVGR